MSRSIPISRVAPWLRGTCTALAFFTSTLAVSAQGAGRILFEYWEGITGSYVANLTANANYPNKPVARDFPDIFECVPNWGENHGGRFRGYVHPPQSGEYVFWIASDNESQLWLSPDDNPANKQQIANVATWTGRRNWTAFPSQESAPLYLEAGYRYYVEVLYKEGTGGDHCAVGWKLPDETLERPMPGDRLSPFAISETVPGSAATLNLLSQGHPRVMASGQGFARAAARVSGVPEVNSRYVTLRNKADSILTQPVSIYEKPDGIRLLAVSRQVLDRVETLAFVYRISGDARYLNRAWSELQAAAGFPDWNPSHFLDTAEMTAAFAIGYDWLYPYWTTAQRDTIRNAIKNKGLLPGRTEYVNRRGWTTSIYNWNAVCNGGLALGAMAVANEEPTLAREIINYALGSLPIGVRDFAPDGGWDEGPGYWDYGTKYLSFFFAGAEAAFGGTFGFAASPGLSETGYYPIYIGKPNGRTFNYSDGGDGGIGGPQLHYFSWRYGQPDFAAFQRARNQSSARELLWFDRRGQSAAEIGLPLDRVFNSCQVSTARTAWGDSQALFAGLKAGNNQQGHEQLDIGTFVLDALGQSWAIELGSDNYNLPGYFGSQRFNYYRLRAEGQNTLVLNPTSGKDQVQTLNAPIIATESTADRAFTIANLTPAYSTRAQSVRRGLDLNRAGNYVILQDEVSASIPAELWWFMHTRASISVDPDGTSATLQLGTKRLWAKILAGPAEAQFTVMSATPLPTSPNPSGQN
ncbi:MAG: PA14 domain-containing protein, partial [Verrucomicrobiota bacterium]|nr:PA14 domain-containing protein [Verrucomicrobiota bacterium]